MRYISIILIMLLLLGSTGCWNAREINELAFVLAIALDKTDDGYKVTAQIAKPETYSKTPSGGGSKQTERPYWLISGSGQTIFEAIRNMAEISPRRIFWSHIKVIIIGERLARSDLLDIFDFFSRNPELRLRTLVAVCPGEAGKLFDVAPLMERDPALHLESVIQKNNLTGKAYRIMLKDFLEDYLDPYINPVATKVEISEVDNQPVVKTEGAAVFNMKKLVGWLNGEETRGLLWMKGKIKSTVMVVPCPYDGLPMSVEIKGEKASIQSSISNGIPVFTIRIKATGNITEKACKTDVNDLKVRHAVEQALDAAIEKDIKSTVTKAQNLGVDFLDMGGLLHRQHKNEWHHQMADNWTQTFPQAEFKIQIDARIPSVSLLAKPLVPIKPGEKED